MALVEGCKHRLDFVIPMTDVEQEREKVALELAKKVRLPGFRPGKAPGSLIKSKFASEIKQDVLDSLVPKVFQKAVERDRLKLAGQPNVVDLHFHEGEDVKFTIEFETEPEFELGMYTDLTVKYEEPVVTAEDVSKRLDELRDQKADFVNIDPRPVETGDHAVVNLRSVAGVEKPVERDEMTFHVGDADAMPVFNEQLLGMTPGETKEFDVTYPDDYGEQNLAGKTVRFSMELVVLRRKELPELNDEFAQDLGDFKNVDELRDQVKAALLRDRDTQARNEAKTQILDKLVETHEFPVPDSYVDRQVRSNLETQLQALAKQGIDPRELNLDWKEVRESQKGRATRDIKASMLLEKIADRESIEPLQDEVDREVQRVARQQRKPVAQVRQDLQKNGTLGRIAGQIRTDKTLNFLFDKARKEA